MASFDPNFKYSTENQIFYLIVFTFLRFKLLNFGNITYINYFVQTHHYHLSHSLYKLLSFCNIVAISSCLFLKLGYLIRIVVLLKLLIWRIVFTVQSLFRLLFIIIISYNLQNIFTQMINSIIILLREKDINYLNLQLSESEFMNTTINQLHN